MQIGNSLDDRRIWGLIADVHGNFPALEQALRIGLPRMASRGPLVLSHGDARLTPALGTSQIGRDFVQAFIEMERVAARVWAFGHSHHARTWRKAGVADPAERVTVAAGRLDSGYRYFLNVGTTGLPFPGKGGPSVALVDFAHGELRHLPLDRAAPE
ncbi:MAG: hypothetical protein LC797_23475 [Chloroflexi bacterium]|nr:hypothetical protein [Chloroflexota bacterium]